MVSEQSLNLLQRSDYLWPRCRILPSTKEVEASHFQLHKRAKHVLTEALRVLHFRHICLRAAAKLPLHGSNAASSADVHKVFEDLGRLMNESQESCARQFECSCPELDELTKIAREAGAYGSRLTGTLSLPNVTNERLAYPIFLSM